MFHKNLCPIHKTQNTSLTCLIFLAICLEAEGIGSDDCTLFFKYPCFRMFSEAPAVAMVNYTRMLQTVYPETTNKISST